MLERSDREAGAPDGPDRFVPPRFDRHRSTTDGRAPWRLRNLKDRRTAFGSIGDRRGPSVAYTLLVRGRMRSLAGFGLAFVIGVVGCGGGALSPDGGQGGNNTAGAGAGGAGAHGGAGSHGGAGTNGSAGTGTGGSNGGGGTGANGGSSGGGLGTVTLQLVVPTSTSFCDQTALCGGRGPHITISTVDGKDVPTIRPDCGVFCGANGTCDQHECAPGPCAISQGIAYTGETSTWDETSIGTSTCGAGVVCTALPRVPDGNYVAHMCATPGTLNMADGGYSPTCTATGPVECVDVPFTIPSATPVVGSLLGSSPCPATLPADGTRCTVPSLICDYPGVDPAGVCRPRATCEVKTPAINWSVTQPAATCGTHPSPCPTSFASIPVGGACPVGASPFQTTCDYVEGRCGCVSCFDDGGASGTMWSCRAWDAGAGSSCPARAPLAGTACGTPDAFCFYGGCGQISIGSDLQCEGGYWQERGISGTCALPSCAPK